MNLTVTRAVVAPAMTIPNFSQSTLMYDRPGDGQTKPNQSVTITTLPPPGTSVRVEKQVRIGTKVKWLNQFWVVHTIAKLVINPNGLL